MRALVALAVALPLATFAQAPEGVPAPAPEYPPPPPSYAPAPPVYPQYAPRGKQRGGWYIGFGIGGGDASITGAGETHGAGYGLEEPVTLAMNFHVGATLSPKLLLGFDGSFNSTQGTTAGLDVNRQINTYGVGVTYFPSERGFFLRASAGLASLLVDIEDVGSDTYGGTNVLGGIGYAWWLGDSFNLTLNLEGAKQWYSEDSLESSQFWNAYVGFSWY